MAKTVEALVSRISAASLAHPLQLRSGVGFECQPVTRLSCFLSFLWQVERETPRRRTLLECTFFLFFFFFLSLCSFAGGALTAIRQDIVAAFETGFILSGNPPPPLFQIHFVLLYHKIQNNNKAFHIYKMYKSLEIILHISVINSFFFCSELLKYKNMKVSYKLLHFAAAVHWRLPSPLFKIKEKK